MTNIYEQINTIDGTNGYTAMSFAAAAVLVILAVALVCLWMVNYRKRADAKQFYLDNVIAFKVGYIQKTAKDKEIEMVYRPKADLMEKLEEEVSKDLNTSS